MLSKQKVSQITMLPAIPRPLSSPNRLLRCRAQRPTEGSCCQKRIINECVGMAAQVESSGAVEIKGCLLKAKWTKLSSLHKTFLPRRFGSVECLFSFLLPLLSLKLFLCCSSIFSQLAMYRNKAQNGFLQFSPRLSTYMYNTV